MRLVLLLEEAEACFEHLPWVEVFVLVTRQELAEEATHADSCILIKYHISYMMGYQPYLIYNGFQSIKALLVQKVLRSWEYLHFNFINWAFLSRKEVSRINFILSAFQKL